MAVKMAQEAEVRAQDAEIKAKEAKMRGWCFKVII
jgi:hypothetical protein